MRLNQSSQVTTNVCSFVVREKRAVDWAFIRNDSQSQALLLPHQTIVSVWWTWLDTVHFRKWTTSQVTLQQPALDSISFHVKSKSRLWWRVVWTFYPSTPSWNKPSANNRTSDCIPRWNQVPTSHGLSRKNENTSPWEGTWFTRRYDSKNSWESTSG